MMRKWLGGLLLPILLLLSPAGAKGQEFALRHFDAEQGVSSNIVYSLFCDHNGYLWMGTDKGVTRYDGFTFKTFTTNDGLPDSEIFGFVEDKEHRLWMSNFSGKLCFYKDGVFHTAQNTPWMELPFTSSSSNLMGLEQDGSVTLLFEKQQQAVNIWHDKVRLVYPGSVNRYADFILAIKKLSPNRYLICRRESYSEVDTNGTIHKEGAYFTPGRYTTAISSDTALLWNTGGIYSLEGRLMYPSTAPYDTTMISFHAAHNKELFWGSVRMHGLMHSGDSTKILAKGHITSIIQDHNDSYWFSTRGNGIFNLSKQFNDIKKYEHVYSNRIIYANASGDTLSFADNTGNFFQLPDLASRQKPALKLPKDPMVSYDLTRGNFLVFTSGDLLRVYTTVDYNNWSFVSRSGKKFSKLFPAFGYLKDVFQVGDYLYILNISSITRVRKDALYHQDLATVDTLVLHHNDYQSRIYSRAVDKNHNQIWFNTVDTMYSAEGTRVVRRPAFQGITFRQFTFLGNYMIGYTDKNKLFICNHYNDRPVIHQVGQQKAMWDYIYPVDDSRAIITSNNYYYLLTLYPSDGQPRYTLHAVENPFIPQQAECIAAGPDNCYFFKNGTITKVATSVLFAPTPPPVPVFSEIRTKTKRHPIHSPVHITYNESSSINILFDNISFLAKDITCEYSISKEEEEDNWHEISGNEINLNTPGFGTYIVKVRAKTLSSQYSAATVLYLVIEKPFWATWWFITISSLVFILLIWLIIQYFSWRKIRKKQREHEADMKFQQSEYKALNALMNPHFIFNSLNNIQGLINKDEKRTANQYLVIFSDMIRQNMHNISKGFISLQQELDLIENYLNLEKLRFKELVNYKIIVEEEVETEDIMIPPLMIQPLVENAIKHGLLPKQSTNGMVRIHVYEKNNLLYIEIEDNGVGITYAKKHHSRLQESFSLSNMQQRAEHLKKIQKQDINIEIKEVVDEYGVVKGTMALVTMELE